MASTAADDAEPPHELTVETQRPPKKLPEWRTFWLVERGEEGGAWFPLKQFTKRTARAAALTAAYKHGDGVARNARIHILDKYHNRVSAFRAVHERIPDDKRTAVQRSRSIDAVVKVYVDGHYKLTAQQSFSERDRRGRRPPNVRIVETSSMAGSNE
mmetsp:Transcript_28448/g.87147  ORF Transcript_28448/g.87147 Transcript_28448/m.87147 type:complete len:157 (-) Transcript_28448:58-528(-)